MKSILLLGLAISGALHSFDIHARSGAQLEEDSREDPQSCCFRSDWSGPADRVIAHRESTLIGEEIRIRNRIEGVSSVGGDDHAASSFDAFLMGVAGSVLGITVGSLVGREIGENIGIPEDLNDLKGMVYGGLIGGIAGFFVGWHLAR